MPVIQGVLRLKVRGKANERVDPCSWDMGGKNENDMETGTMSRCI